MLTGANLDTQRADNKISFGRFLLGTSQQKNTGGKEKRCRKDIFLKKDKEGPNSEKYHRKNGNSPHVGGVVAQQSRPGHLHRSRRVYHRGSSIALQSGL